MAKKKEEANLDHMWEIYYLMVGGKATEEQSKKLYNHFFIFCLVKIRIWKIGYLLIK